MVKIHEVNIACATLQCMKNVWWNVITSGGFEEVQYLSHYLRLVSSCTIHVEYVPHMGQVQGFQ